MTMPGKYDEKERVDALPLFLTLCSQLSACFGRLSAHPASRFFTTSTETDRPPYVREWSFRRLELSSPSVLGQRAVNHARLHAVMILACTCAAADVCKMGSLDLRVDQMSSERRRNAKMKSRVFCMISTLNKICMLVSDVPAILYKVCRAKPGK